MRRVIELVSIETFQKGEKLFEKGQTSEVCYLVLYGDAFIYNGDLEVNLAILENAS